MKLTTKTKNISAIFLLILLAFALSTRTLAEQTEGAVVNPNSEEALSQAIMFVDPVTIMSPELAPSNNFTITINITDVLDLFTWQTKLWFNPTIIECTDADYPSGHVFDGQTFIPVEPNINNTGGFVLYGASLLLEPLDIDQGVLCALEFHVLDTGSCALTFDEVDSFLLDFNLNDIPRTLEDGFFDNREPLAGNMLWIEPPTMILTGADVGGRFNVTLWVNLTNTSFLWQIKVLFNATYFQATRIDYTGDGKSEFFSGHTTVPVTPIIDNIEGSVMHGETLLGMDHREPGCGSLCWIEFETVAMPPKDLTIKFSEPYGKDTFLLDPDLQDIPIEIIKNTEIQISLPPPQAMMFVDPASMVNPELGPCSNFTITINITDVINLFAWQTKLWFNPTIIECTDAYYPVGHVFDGQTFIPVEPIIDNTAGYVTYGCTLLLETVDIEQGVLCALKFHVLDTGSCDLVLDRVSSFYLDYDLNEIPKTVRDGFFDNRGLGWDVVLTASMEGYNDVSEFGVRGDATEGFDPEYDLIDPPSPVSGVVSYFWYPDNVPPPPIDFRKLSRSRITRLSPWSWEYHVHPVNLGNGLMVIEWSDSEIANIPGEYGVYLQCPDGSVVDMRQATKYNFTAVSCITYEFMIYVGGCSSELQLSVGWNMVSFPCLPINATWDDLLGDCGFYQVLTWDGSGYVIPKEPEFGYGYWVLVLEDCSVSIINGIPCEHYERNLSAGWSMIGSIVNCAVDADCVFPGYYQLLTWDGSGYVPSDAIEPGKGYWSLVFEATHITVDDSCCITI